MFLVASDKGVPAKGSVVMTPNSAPPPASQTLSRGLRILEVLAEARTSLRIDELAAQLGVHRSITYRLVRTLEEHGMVTRDPAGTVSLGVRLASLAAGIAHDLQATARPELAAAADDLGMTCFLAVLDRDECITLVSAQPRHAVASMAQRPGSRHPVTAGAPGRAILSLVPESQWPQGVSQELAGQVHQVRRRGYATSRDEVIPTVQAVSVPLELRGHRPAAIAALHVSTPLPPSEIADRLAVAAAAVRGSLGN